MRRVLPSFVPILTLALGLVGCVVDTSETVEDEQVGERSEAIAGGYGDVADHAVVGLAATDEAGYMTRTCTGTLIAPNLVVTAQHCVAETASFVVCESAYFGASLPASRVFVTTSASMWSEETSWLPAVEIVVPPGVPEVCGRDIALVVLASPVPAQVAEPLVPRFDRLVAPTEIYSAVGYGNTGQGYEDGGVRRRRDDLIVTCAGASCESDHVDPREWRGDHGICNGDSGGPAIDGAGAVIGVTSRGPTGCDNPIYGSLAPWGPWIRGVASSAALAGAYEAPSWVDDESRIGEAVLLGQFDADTAASCSQAPGKKTSKGAAAAVAIGLALVAGSLRRRMVVGR